MSSENDRPQEEKMNAENARQCLTDIESPYRRITAMKKTRPLNICELAHGLGCLPAGEGSLEG
jgi:hypothetical protein